jgi:hypothetical protein
VNNRLRFVKKTTDKIDKDVNGPGAWFYARHGLLEPNNHPGDIGDYQRALVIWLKDNNEENVFVDKNAPLNELCFKDGAEIAVPKDECSIACIVDTYVGHNLLHGGTVHVHLPRNGLNKPEWAVTELIPPYNNIRDNTDTGTPGDMATLSVECDETKIHIDDEITFNIYKKGAVPNGVNRIDGGTGTKKAGISKVGWDWYYKYEDKDYPVTESAPRPVYFFEAFSNCMDVVTSGKEFTTVWVRLDNAKLQQLETDVQTGMQTQTQYVIKLEQRFWRTRRYTPYRQGRSKRPRETAKGRHVLLHFVRTTPIRQIQISMRKQHINLEAVRCLVFILRHLRASHQLRRRRRYYWQAIYQIIGPEG